MLPNDIPGHNPDSAMPEGIDEAKALLHQAGIDPGSITLDFVFLNARVQQDGRRVPAERLAG